VAQLSGLAVTLFIAITSGIFTGKVIDQVISNRDIFFNNVYFFVPVEFLSKYNDMYLSRCCGC
jgi:hypothetical protein